MRQKVNRTFGSNSEGVGTHKKIFGCRKVLAFDLIWFKDLKSGFWVLGFQFKKVNCQFGDDSEGVETHKKSSGYRKSRSFDL